MNSVNARNFSQMSHSQRPRVPESRQQRFGDLTKDPGGVARRLPDDNGFTRVAAGPDFGYQRHLAEQGGPEFFGGHNSATGAKELMLAARGINEVAHVFRHAQDGDIDLLEHHAALAGHVGGGGLGRGHDDGPVERQGLDQR